MGEVVGQEPLHFQLENKPVRTKRIERLYEYVGASRVGMCLERGSIITDVYRKHRDLPPILLRATALSEILDKMSIYLLPGSLLAGNQASKPNYAPLFPEFAVDFIEEEFLNGKPYFPDERPADRIEYNREDLPKLREIIQFWRGNTHKDRLYANLPGYANIRHNCCKIRVCILRNNQTDKFGLSCAQGCCKDIGMISQIFGNIMHILLGLIGNIRHVPQSAAYGGHGQAGFPCDVLKRHQFFQVQSPCKRIPGKPGILHDRKNILKMLC